VVWLVLDTSAPTAAVGIVDVDRGRVVAECLLGEPRRHAEALPAAVDAVLADAGLAVGALDGVGVGVGPGSFIGVRTGIAFAKGLGRAIDRPVVGLSSLLALALSEPALPRGRGLVLVDAKRAEHYVADAVVDEAGVVAVGPVATVVVGDARLGADTAFVVGAVDNVDPDVDVPRFARSGAAPVGLLRALQGKARADERSTLVPSYVRAPDAKMPAIDPARHRPTTTTEGP
jgi:tRNA threonylcarbamoyladenosine biosynthesis protein TsaB